MCLSISAALVSQNALVPDKDLTCQYEPYLALFSVLKTLSKRSTHKSQCVHLKNADKYTNIQRDTPRNAHQLRIHVISCFPSQTIPVTPRLTFVQISLNARVLYY